MGKQTAKAINSKDGKQDKHQEVSNEKKDEAQALKVPKLEYCGKLPDARHQRRARTLSDERHAGSASAACRC